MALTEQALRRFLPDLPDAPGWVQPINDACNRFAISSSERLAAFLAQVAHESGHFRRLEENLNYSAKGLVGTWPKRFTSLDMAEGFARQPEKIANRVYASRLGNGDEASGDGWRFRGRGLIQLTGRGNYRTAGTALAMPLETQPELLLQRQAAALAAGHFWASHGLNELADNEAADNDDEDFTTISIKINGGRVGLADRFELWRRARAAFV